MKGSSEGKTGKGPGAEDEPVKALRFLTLRQVAEELNTKESTIRALIRTGEIPAIQVGGRGQWRLGRVDVETYITAAYVRAAGDIGRGNTVVSLEEPG
ncbi:helix-turn-helix domain-containing protein [Arthrobacter sp. H41]|uniref:helix-turn-helix domain-containing protein n=1 Tax=Arthrobacter sp. H41 TaxID=1312978 RepID=UPI0004B0F0BA|nr:helix-turn-helix domain-containing protein [Arthrobacter sp. H41]